VEITTIIFDFGGVLLDWNPRYLYRQEFGDEAAMESFLTRIGWEEWNLQQDKGRSLEQGTELLERQFPEFRSKIQQFYGQWDKMLKGEIPENVALLPELKQQYKLYGLTNWSAEIFPMVQKMFSFFKLFDGIVVSGEEKLVKPDEKIFRVILERYHIDPKRTLFIDDNQKNIDAAIKMGLSTIHVTQQTDLRHELQVSGLLSNSQQKGC
jgi:2-haloacid dehalogenase